MRYVFDLDGTLCTTTDGDYNVARPLGNRIARVNQLFDSGHDITIYTARGMGRNKNNQVAAITQFYDMTLLQLHSWGVKFHDLRLGKPSGDIYVDDKGMSDAKFFTD
tara:strand:+ start:1491 stop:1811 length:321 start_codon:yes stop_codon:yes gene_type:complete